MKKTSPRSGDRPLPTPNYSFSAPTKSAMRPQGPSMKSASTTTAPIVRGVRRFKDCTSSCKY